ncbi:MAG: hypothetical protein LBR30_04280 [Clostridioides sp.]|jgi:hypothetical protein|nr:hypothetical protein [Clostridioides sp.]
MVNLKENKVKLVLFIVSLILGLFVYFIYKINHRQSLNVLTKKDVVILSNLDGDICARQGDIIAVSIPVYDFKDQFKNGNTIRVEHFDIGDIKNIQLEEYEIKEGVNIYCLNFELIPEKIGKFELDNIGIKLSTIDKKEPKKYYSKLGTWKFDVQEKKSYKQNSEKSKEDTDKYVYDDVVDVKATKDDLDVKEILGSTAFDSDTGVQRYYTKLKNISNFNVNLKRIELNDKYVFGNNLGVKKLGKNKDLTIEKSINLKKATLIKPKLIYETEDGQEKVLYLGQTEYITYKLIEDATEIH